jgi:hypothetical protein
LAPVKSVRRAVLALHEPALIRGLAPRLRALVDEGVEVDVEVEAERVEIVRDGRKIGVKRRIDLPLFLQP